MIIGVPLMQMLVLVFAATYDLKKIDMVVVDHDLSTASRELIAKFDGIPFYNVFSMVPGEQFGEEMLLNEFFSLLILGIIFFSLATWRYRKTT